MAQTIEKIEDHETLFRQPEYQEMLKGKKAFEGGPSSDEVAKICDWTKTAEYREINFAREALSINPAKSCQPLGAMFAHIGFAKTLPVCHGSQGCIAYFRSHLTPPFQGTDFRRFHVHDGRCGPCSVA